MHTYRYATAIIHNALGHGPNFNIGRLSPAAAYESQHSYILKYHNHFLERTGAHVAVPEPHLGNS